MKFIAFIGEDRSGKTTMSKSLQELVHRGCRYKAEMISWADSLREEIMLLYGLPYDIIFNRSINKNETIILVSDYDYDSSLPALWKKHKLIKKIADFKDLKITLRDLIINHGTHIRRAEDPRYWVKKFDEKVTNLTDDFDFVIIDDTRFDTEFEYLLDKDTQIYYLSNGSKNKTNHAQDSLLNWVDANRTRIKTYIKTSIPLLIYEADKLNISNVIKRLPPPKAKVSGSLYTSIPRFRPSSFQDL